MICHHEWRELRRRSDERTTSGTAETDREERERTQPAPLAALGGLCAMSMRHGSDPALTTYLEHRRYVLRSML